jgi:hypothetical protein
MVLDEREIEVSTSSRRLSGIEDSERVDLKDLSSTFECFVELGARFESTMIPGAEAEDLNGLRRDSGIQDSERADMKDLSSIFEYFGELDARFESTRIPGAEADDPNGIRSDSQAFSIGRSNSRAVKGLDDSDVNEDDTLFVG